MTIADKSAHDYGAAGEARLRTYVEEATGGRIVRMDRQVRWRPAWFVDVEKDDGQILKLYLRGNREGDVAIFPDLKREADIIRILHENGVPVPRVYGYCAEPPAFAMDMLPGTRDMELAAPEDRPHIGREYMRAVAAMHAVPVEKFTEAGVELPDAEDISLTGLNAYMPLYRRTKAKPEPMLEFVIGWIRRNAPKHRTKRSLVQFDSGQFQHENGEMTGLYDFEFSMAGDPMADFATMRLRDSNESLGEDLRVLCRHYEEFSGEPVDHEAIDFHTLVFATVATMQFCGTVANSTPGDPHATYLEFDLALRQDIFLGLSALSGIVFEPEAPAAARTGDNAALIAKLDDVIRQIEAASPYHESLKDAAGGIIEWLVKSDAMGAEMKARNIADVEALLGRQFTDWPDAEAALEEYVLQAGPEQDETLMRLFAAIEGRRMQMFGDTKIGKSATVVTFPPTR